VIEYRLEEGEDITYRLITSILDPSEASAMDLAALYTQRWEIEITFDEFKTHLRGRNIVMRSKTPSGVLQEFWGFILAHNAIRTIMHDAATRNNLDPDRISFVHSLRIVQRRIPQFVIIPPSGEGNAV
jgi:IS4 transposase